MSPTHHHYHRQFPINIPVTCNVGYPSQLRSPSQGTACKVATLVRRYRQATFLPPPWYQHSLGRAVQYESTTNRSDHLLPAEHTNTGLSIVRTSTLGNAFCAPRISFPPDTSQRVLVPWRRQRRRLSVTSNIVTLYPVPCDGNDS